MPESSLTPQEYELHLEALRARLKDYVDKGVGDRRAILKEAEQVLELADSYPDVAARHGDVEGLVAEILAKQQQARFLGGQTSGQKSESPGCLLGWLFGRGK